ncbi:O-antigen/teichoic acid export membrane protein [Maribacter caenipelagi]|uniref:O-antigen/teichoic acid export membrane protein n=1 Tax=Maribacter caenipelagi TaxID=1447781 RepID=A0A4R7D0C9_9FLAO|nr:sugar transporter [Maribacter caenipelagi]TDS13441.1 O-antigen/teichoic acid export membrane protein [Maribacter caenipelagi]
MSRLSNTIKNAKIGVLFHVIFILVQFFSRKIFLENLGDEFIGTTSTLQSFLGFLNLAELGIGSAIGFALYKPIFKKDYKEINLIIQFVGNLYKKIGIIVIIAGLILSFFFPLIFNESYINIGIIYYAFYTFLFSSILGYFFNYHIFLIQADQKDYVISKYYQSFAISKIVLQALSVYFFQNFIIWISLEWISSSLFSIIIRKKVKKMYPWLELNFLSLNKRIDFENRILLLAKIKQISIHKLGGFLNSGTDNILIFYFINAQSVAFFGNYQLIILNIGTLVEKLFAGSKASVGNLVAENNEKSIHQVLWEMMALRFFIGGFTVSCIILLINPFIELWLGKEYILNPIVVALFCSIFFIKQIVNPIEAFKQAYGLYDDTWAPITEGILNLIISILFAKKYGLIGILLGTNVSLFFIVAIWRPYYVYRDGFKKPIAGYILGFIKLMILASLAFLSSKFITDQFFNLKFHDFIDLMISTIKIILITGICYITCLYSGSSYYRAVLKRLKNQFFKK